MKAEDDHVGERADGENCRVGFGMLGSFTSYECFIFPRLTKPPAMILLCQMLLLHVGVVYCKISATNPESRFPCEVDAKDTLQAVNGATCKPISSS